MGQITSGVGLISGINTADLINQLLALEERPKQLVQQRNAVLTSQQVAFQDINAKLLALKLSASDFTDQQTFQSTSATSTDETVLTASSTTSAVPGTYDFVVDQLVSTQQVISNGFLDRDATPIAPQGGTLTFEFGPAGLESDTELSDLNGGSGVQRGKIRITDRSGASTVVDLSKALTVDDVLEAINDASGIDVTASVEADGFKLVDNTGQTAANLSVAEVSGGKTASELGLLTAAVGDTLTGSQVHRVSTNTFLTQLNDRNGVRTNTGVDDFQVTRRDGTTFNVNLDNASTLNDVIAKIATASGGNVTAAINADSTGLQLVDSTTGDTTFAVTALNGSNAAVDLGILASDDDANGTIDGQRVIASLNSKLLKNLNGGSGVSLGSTDNTLTGQTLLTDLFQGSGITPNGNGASPDLFIQDRSGATYQVEVDGLTTVQDLINAFNTATGGAVTLDINGQSLRATNSTIGLSNFQIQDVNGSSVANELGIEIDSPLAGSDTVTGNDTDPQLRFEISITNRNGSVFEIDVDGLQTVEETIRHINDAGAGVVASINTVGNGITITDTTGGNGDLILSGALFDDLNLSGTYDTNTPTADSGNLQLRYISESTLLSSLNGGAGVSRGRFTITDSTGASATVDLSQGDETTIQNVIDEINSRGIAVLARINDNGDGILIEDTGPGTVALSVAEAGSSTARDLGILGEAEQPGDDIDGSFEKTINLGSVLTLEGSTTLAALNGGEGVNKVSGQDDFKITTRDGTEHNINLDGTTTVQNVIDKIATDTGGSVTVTINAVNGTLKLTDNTAGAETFSVEVLNESDAASDLGILSEDENDDGVINGQPIIEITTLDDLVNEINSSGFNVSATVINDGSSTNPFRLNLQATVAGSAGAFLFDDGGLGFGTSTLVEAQDAVAFFGSSNPATAVAIKSTSNTLETAIPGATIDLLSTSDSPVRVTINRDDSAIISAVSRFVERFNDVASTLDQVDSYNAETEERGLLLGDATVARVRSSLFRIVNNRNTDLTGAFSTLAQIGVTIGSGAQLRFDETKFRNALATDPDAVEQLFTFKQTETDEDTNEITTVAAGIGVRIDELLDRLTDSSSGVLQARLDSIGDQIQLGERRIEQLDALLESKRARLEAQFVAMETALAQLQNQSSALAGIQAIAPSPISGITQ